MYMYIYICIYIYICMYILRIHIFTHVHICMYTYIHVYIHVYAYICAYTHVHIQIHIYKYTYTYIFIRIYTTCTYIHMDTFVSNIRTDKFRKLACILTNPLSLKTYPMAPNTTMQSDIIASVFNACACQVYIRLKLFMCVHTCVYV